MLFKCQIHHIVLYFLIISINFSYNKLFTNGQTLEQHINELVQNVSECFQIPGVSVSVVRLNESGEVVQKLAKGYGRVDPQRETIELVSSTTRFCIGSITKQFTSGLLGTILKTSKFGFRRPLISILGNDEGFFNNPDLDQLPNVQDLLAHRMGIPKYEFTLVTGLTGNREDVWGKLHLLGDNSSSAISKFRTSFIFNDWMYSLAGYTCQTMNFDGLPWEDQIEDTYFESLNMTNATFLHADHKWHNFAISSYRIGNESAFKILNMPKEFMKYNANYFAPSGSICVSAEDMLKYMSFLLFPNESADNSVLKESILQTMFETSNVLVDKSVQQTLPLHKRVFTVKDYALGWRSGLYREFAQYSHEGNLFGYNSHIIIFPELFIGIYVSTTSGPSTVNYAKELSLAIFDLLMDSVENPLTAEEICSMASPTVFPDPLTIEPLPQCNLTHGFEDDLEQLTGVYVHPVFGDFKVNLIKSAQHPLQFRFGVFGRGVLCPMNKNFLLTNKFRLYFDTTTPMWLYNLPSSPSWNSSYVIFRKNRGGLSVVAELPLLEPAVASTVKVLLTRQNFNSCNPNPCLHGGTCIANGNLNFRCTCPPLLSGLMCEKFPQRDCTDYMKYARDPPASGLYNITLPNNLVMEVFCDMTTDGGGWTVMQRRVDDSVSFNRSYADYVEGFGSAEYQNNYWMGLSNMHLLCPDASYNCTLRVDLLDCDQNSVYELYNNFWIDSDEKQFTFNVKKYSARGTAGDGLSFNNPWMEHNGRPFVTPDHDANDIYNCAKTYWSGWWYASCYAAHLNGLYHVDCEYQGIRNGIEWLPWISYQYSMKYARMSLKRIL